MYVDTTEVRVPRRARIRIVVMFSGEKIRPFSAIIVEGWGKVVTPGSRSGSKNRKWCAEFTEHERKLLRRWHTKMWVWEIYFGHPVEIGMTLSTYALIERAVNFFAYA